MLLELLQVKGRFVVCAGFRGNKVGCVKAKAPIHRHKSLGRSRFRGKGRGHGTQERQGYSRTGTLEKGTAIKRMFFSDITHLTC